MSEKLKEIIYKPEPVLLNPANLFKSMVYDLLSSRELAWRLFVRNINAQYRQTILGYFWAFIPPIFVTAIWVYLSSQKILNIEYTGMPYPLFVLTGTILWQTFVDAINSPLKMMNESKAMLTKVNFPREALILAGLAEVIFNFLIRLFLLFAIFTYYEFTVTSSIVMVPVGVISIITMGLMIGLMLTPLGVLYNDISRAILIITQAWFFLTPVIYPVPKSTIASSLITYNPVTPLIVMTREWLVTGNNNLITNFILISAVSFVLLIISWILYRIAMPHLIARISA